jgi:hypothetical protein
LVSEEKIKLSLISRQVSGSQVSLPELGKLYGEAKEIFLSISDLDDEVGLMMLNIFNKGIEKVGGFFTEWLNKGIQPTDEELDLLEKAFNEASWAFDFLSTAVPDVLSAEDNQA